MCMIYYYYLASHSKQGYISQYNITYEDMNEGIYIYMYLHSFVRTKVRRYNTKVIFNTFGIRYVPSNEGNKEAYLIYHIIIASLLINYE